MIRKPFLIYLILLSLTFTSCANTSPSPSGQPVSEQETLKERATVDKPTYTLQPTFTPQPTPPAVPTQTPVPTHTPVPTVTPVPTSTATPTYSVNDALLVTRQADAISTQGSLTNCRYGVTAGSTNRPLDRIEYFAAGHQVIFGTFISSLPESVEPIPQVRIKQDKQDGQYLPTYSVDPPLTMDQEGLGPILKANPRGLWIVGNEPEVANDSQDNTYPEIYARVYHEVYTFIKQHDPHAQVAIAGLSMMTPGRLQYLDIVWDTYLKEFGEPIPVDVWNTHLYVLPELRQEDGGHGDGKIALGTDPELAKKSPQGDAESECPKEDVYCRSEHDDVALLIQQIVALRSWMKEHGQQNKPLLVTEFSLLYPFVDYDDPLNPSECFLMDEFGQCFTEKRVSDFLVKTIHYFEEAKDPELGYPADNNRLVQQWTWYSLWTEAESSGGSSNLLVDDYYIHHPESDLALTQAGLAFQDWARSSETTVNLVAGEAPDIEAKAGVGGTADIELEVGFYNNGSTGITDSFKVSFYEDIILTRKIGEIEISPLNNGTINGCSWGRSTESASIIWQGVPVGAHTFWAKIDSDNQIDEETNETDNMIGGKVTVRS